MRAKKTIISIFITLQISFCLCSCAYMPSEMQKEIDQVAKDALESAIDEAKGQLKDAVNDEIRHAKHQLGDLFNDLFDQSKKEPETDPDIANILFPLDQDLVWRNVLGSSAHKVYSTYDDTHAMDFNYGSGTDDKEKAVYAIEDGMVSKHNPDYGGIWVHHTKKITLTDGTTLDQFYSAYLHMENISIKKGSNLFRGDQIGTIGGMGKGQADYYDPHLHFALYKVEPDGYLKSISPSLIPNFSEYYKNSYQ